MESLCISYVSASATNFFFSRGSGKKKKRKREQPQRQRSSTPTTPVSAEVVTPDVSDDEESNVRVDIADIVEVREGFATDTFNEAAKNADNLKIATYLKVPNQRSHLKSWQYWYVIPSFHAFKAENSFSLIFSTKFGRPNTLDLGCLLLVRTLSG